jgi:hypothetical protein
MRKWKSCVTRLFAKSDVAKQRELAEKVQLRAIEIGTHAWLGQWEPIAYRKDRVDGWIEAPVTVSWNVKKGASVISRRLSLPPSLLALVDEVIE